MKPVKPGAAIGVIQPGGRLRSVGTLGCLVSRGGKRFLLTAGHVLAPPRGDNVVYQAVVRPAALAEPAQTGSRAPGKPKWTRGPALARIVGDGAGLASIDCAIAAVAPHRVRVVPKFPDPIGRLDSTFVHEDEIEISPREVGGGMKVQIHGARSKHRTGYATRGVTYSIKLSDGKFRIEPPLIEIAPSFEEHIDFCGRGDSGALVVSAPGRGRPRPIGVLVATAKVNITRRGYAVPIRRVVSAIGPGAAIVTG